jgi:hypothetical protein
MIAFVLYEYLDANVNPYVLRVETELSVSESSLLWLLPCSQGWSATIVEVEDANED